MAGGRNRPYYSGKHKCHGLNVQVLADPAGRLIWVSPTLPGSRHDIGAAREHGILDTVADTGYLSDALPAETEQACRDIVPRIRDAGATAARGVRVDDTHLVLILEFASAQDADRVATDVGGPWMRERILPLLARGPERSVGEVIASATA